VSIGTPDPDDEKEDEEYPNPIEFIFLYGI